MQTLPPGPGLPGPLQTIAWGLRPLRFYDACRRRYGPTFTRRFYDGSDTVVVSRLEDVRALCALSGDELVVGADNSNILEPFLGPRSLLMLDGAEHHDERRRLQHAFRATRLETFRELVVAATRADIATWPTDKPFRIHDRTKSITLDVILRAVFGIDGKDEGVRRTLGTFLDGSSGSLFVLIPPFRRNLGGHSPWARFVRERDAVHAEVLDLVARRRQADDLTERHDILSALLEGEGVSDGQLLDELMTLVLAGHDTTATALAWAFDLLLHHRAVLERLRAELLEGRDEYLDAVVHESLRLRPVVSEFGRRLVNPLQTTVGRLPAGTNVVANIWLTHTDPDRYPDPLTFRPERFLDAPPDLATWLPFGGGVRRCLGAGFATLEIREVLRTVVTNVDLLAGRDRMDQPKRRAVTLMPRRGTLVRVDRMRAEGPRLGSSEQSTGHGGDPHGRWAVA